MTLLVKDAERRQRAAEQLRDTQAMLERIARRGSIKGYRRPVWWQRFLKAGKRLTR